MVRKMLLLAAGLIALVAAPVAAQYSAIIDVSDTVVAPGGSTEVAGSGFAPGDVALSLVPDASARAISADGVSLGGATVGADGTFSQSVVIPAAADPGTYYIYANQPASVARVAITVAAAGTTPTVVPTSPGTGTTSPGSLPRTGSTTKPIVLVGVGLLAAGGMVLLANRRRSAATV